jgi:uncharacterized protein (TIGR02646 family)
MKYIQKGDPPQFFIDDTSGLTYWSEYSATKAMRVKKKKLKKHILDNEQFGLCCYCEKEITIDSDSSHIEHVKPKSLDLSSLTFDYDNLLVSCEGNHFNEIGDNSKNTCGQIKNDFFDELRFLNPTLVNDISAYFIFDRGDGTISASSVDKVKADYTYQILNLNGRNNKLAEARIISKDAFIRNLPTLSVEERRKIVEDFLQNDTKEFITFFRYFFRKRTK